MAKYVSDTDLSYYHGRIKTLFASQTDLDALDTKVDGIIAEGGEPNVIEGIKINGASVAPDADKVVSFDVPVELTTNTPAYLQTEVVRGGFGVDFIGTIPVNTSDLTNDGDGESAFATETYVSEHGGKIDVIQVNGTAQTITNKTVNIPVPTNNNELTNGAGYQTASEVSSAIDAALADITGIDFQVVQTLPSTGEHGVIYLVPKTGTTGDTYDEYIWVAPTGGTAHFEQIGTTQVDLSDYWSKTELVAMTTAEIDALFA